MYTWSGCSSDKKRKGVEEESERMTVILKTDPSRWLSMWKADSTDASQK